MRAPGRSLTFLLGIIATILVGWVLHAGAGILQPLVIALLLTNVLQPLVRRLAAWHIPPPVTVILLTVLLFFGLAQAGMLLQANLESILTSNASVPTDPILPHLVDEEPGEAAAEPGSGPAPAAGEDGLAAPAPGWPSVKQRIEDMLQAPETRMPKTLAGMVINGLEQIDPQALAADLIGSGLGFTRGLVLVMIYMIFIFAEQAVFKRKILAIAGDRREEAAEVLDTIAIGIQRYLGVKTLVSLLTGTIAYLLLVLLGVQYALLFGLMTFLLNYIPTFGSIVAGILPAVYALATHGWGTVAIIIVSYLALNFLLGNFLEPKVLGRELNLSPLVIVISVVFWGSLWGVLGAFLAVPLTASVQIILATQERTRAIAVMLSSRPPADGTRAAAD
ncbi:MAG: AI-2E family transporter [Planctomycetota bacterium]|nr:MAG: AI-2E family transporter [Planctomycetota bacterium]